MYKKLTVKRLEDFYFAITQKKEFYFEKLGGPEEDNFIPPSS